MIDETNRTLLYTYRKLHWLKLQFNCSELWEAARVGAEPPRLLKWLRTSVLCFQDARRYKGLLLHMRLSVSFWKSTFPLEYDGLIYSLFSWLPSGTLIVTVAVHQKVIYLGIFLYFLLDKDILSKRTTTCSMCHYNYEAFHFDHTCGWRNRKHMVQCHRWMSCYSTLLQIHFSLPF